MDTMNKKEEFMNDLKNYEKPVEDNKKEDPNKVSIDKDTINFLEYFLSDAPEKLSDLANRLARGEKIGKEDIINALARSANELREARDRIMPVAKEVHDKENEENRKPSELEEQLGEEFR